jgi:hypothetical protein
MPNDPSKGEASKITGKALRRTKGEIRALSSITRSDVEIARFDWKAKTLPDWRELIEAERIR